MKILLTLPFVPGNERLMPPDVLRALERHGTVVRNPYSRPLTKTELCTLIHDCSVCVTSWNTPTLDATVLAAAPRLKFVAHLGGTVAPIVSAELYGRGVRVSSANRVLARYVAEGILAYILTAQRDIPFFDGELHAGSVWPRDVSRPRSLYDQRVGFIGLGTVGRFLLDLLQPFKVSVAVFDPHVTVDVLAPWPFARLGRIEDVLAGSAVLSVHASLTSETTGLLGETQLRLVPTGALVVNAARGAIIDEAALTAELVSGRLRACLDVYTEEPLPSSSRLRSLPNVVLGPHLAGVPSHAHFAEAMAAEVGRFVSGLPLEHEVPFEQFARMTRTAKVDETC